MSPEDSWSWGVKGHLELTVSSSRESSKEEKTAQRMNQRCVQGLPYVFRRILISAHVDKERNPTELL